MYLFLISNRRIPVIALDTNPTRLALARHNAVIYGVADRIEFILADCLSFARSYLSLPSTSNRKIDVVFLSPPWGGPSYLSGSATEAAEATAQVETGDDPSEDLILAEAHPEYSLASIQPIHGAKLFQLSRRISSNIAYFLPRNTNLDEISALLHGEQSGGVTMAKAAEGGDAAPEVVEVEEEWMGSKLKALTCYFGGLVDGQDHLF
jgi:trimethylguanosine synthase